jgi:anti-sigma factor RsiW
MNNHDELRELLPLAAAGGLDGEDAAAVRKHLGQCATCAEEFKRWETVVSHVAKAPVQPEVPAWLAQRTIQRVKHAREATEQKRWNNRVLAGLVAFSWATALASWPVVHYAAGIGLWPWLGLSMVLCWVTAGSAAVILGSHSSIRERKI